MVESFATDLEASHGCQVLPIVRDLGDASACESVVPLTLERFGQVDILVNAASMLSRTPLDQVTTNDFDRMFHVNTRAPFLLSRAAMRDMKVRRWGRIINVTATSVYTGGVNDTSALYDGAKGAVSVLTKVFAKYGAEFGVLVNTVCPGPMRTSMLLEETAPEIVQEVVDRTPLGRMADATEVANMICWLASAESSFATGATFNINGGLVMHS
jgi:NAD(P)-dependent dehydrogenase (short-subunit alcohol dehydrogenase family)